MKPSHESSLNLFLLGSCRIHRPIRKMMDQKKCILLNRKDPLWFMHTSRAALQAIQFIKGELQPPLHLRELIFETDNAREIEFEGNHHLNKTDVLIIEICSLTSIDIDGWEANAHRVNRAEKLENPITKRVTKKKYNAQEIGDDLHEISKKIQKPILLVNHISHTGIEKVDSSRAQLTSILKEVVSRNKKILLFDTAPLIKNSKLEKTIEDNNHYCRDFEPVIGEAILDYAKNHYLNSEK